MWEVGCVPKESIRSNSCLFTSTIGPSAAISLSSIDAQCRPRAPGRSMLSNDRLLPALFGLSRTGPFTVLMLSKDFDSDPSLVPLVLGSIDLLIQENYTSCIKNPFLISLQQKTFRSC